MTFHRNILKLDAAAEADRIVAALRRHVRRVFRKQGAVVGVSGGVDSAVVLTLCVQAFGAAAVTPLLLPERDSSPESRTIGERLCRKLGATPIVEDLTGALQGFDCYARRDHAVSRVFPGYNAQSASMKIGVPQDLLEAGTLNVFSLTVVAPDGTEATKPLAPQEFLAIVAATNFKQRARMAMLYYHAELRNYAVVGTANKNEHGQGFFVKHGDGAADIQPIAHLFKTQVYELAHHLNVPDEIIERAPTSDTYSAPSTQQEFFFRVPFETMDLIWHAMEHEVPVDEVAQVMNLPAVQVQRVFDELRRKQRGTEFLRTPPIHLAEPQAVAESMQPAITV